MFDKVYVVTGISTQGRPQGGGQVNDQYVASYKVRYSEDCDTFYTYPTAAGDAEACLPLSKTHWKYLVLNRTYVEWYLLYHCCMLTTLHKAL